MDKRINIIIVGFGEIGQYTAFNLLKNKISKNNVDYNIIAIDIKNDLEILFDEVKNIPVKRSILDLNLNNEDFNILITCLPTNVRMDYKDFGAVLDTIPFDFLAEDIQKLQKEKNINFDAFINRSTVYPKFAKNYNIHVVKAKYYAAAPERYNSKIINGIKTFDSEDIVIGIERYNEDSLEFKLFKSVLENLADTIQNKKIHWLNSPEEAEIAKLFENVQRHTLISLENLFSLYCDKLAVNYNNVAQAAKTKSNYVNVKPGIVGGHCIGVDDYWFAYNRHDIEREFVDLLHIIDSKYKNFIEVKATEKIVNCHQSNPDKKIVIFGITYKPNSDSLTNSKNYEAYRKIKLLLEEFNINVSVFDPFLKNKKIKNNIPGWIDIDLDKPKELENYKFFILVNHDSANKIPKELRCN